MSRTVEKQAEQIRVVDQVGKHHIVVKYIEMGEPPNAERDAVTEYRLGSGRVVERTGTYTFQSVDGRLHFRVI
jgi:hypothetical protein